MRVQNYLKKVRGSLGMTQEEFAKHLGITRSLLAGLENGKKAQMGMLALLRKRFGLSIDDLIDKGDF